MKNHPLVHHTLKNLRHFGVRPGDQLAIALSGGADSVALFHLLQQAQGVLGVSLHVLHVHHGDARDSIQRQYRDRAQVFCEGLAREFDLPFYTNLELPAAGSLNSEAEFREFRWQWFRTWSHDIAEKTGQRVLVALGHHREDLLETRLIHLIRGAGEKGLVGFSSHDNEKIRPLFDLSRGDLIALLGENHLPWVEDPSNQHNEVLRNFLRNEWLPALDEARPGSVQSLGRSLEILSSHQPDTLRQPEENLLMAEGRLSRTKLLQLSRNEQKAAVAQYFSRLPLRHYGHSHVEEFLKRLDTPQKDFTFAMLSQTWSVSEQWVEASRV